MTLAQNEISPGRGGESSSRAKPKNNLVMLVNRYVPHYQIIPARLTKNDFKIFVHQPFETEDEKEKFDKMKNHIEEFDHVLISSLMGDRERKFK